MKAQDIMTRQVVTVTPDTPVAAVAKLMTEHRISGLPVVAKDGRILGVVSVSDLVHRVETGTQRKRKWWAALFTDSQSLAREFVKTHGQTVADIMSRKVVCVAADADLRHVADVLDRNNVKRVPVLHQGKLAGILSRTDLVRAVASAQVGSTAARGDDGEIQRTLIERMDQQPWLSPTLVHPVVTAEQVELWGFVSNEEQHRALRVLVSEVAGSRTVNDNIKIGLPPFGES